jgi:hypothetical protein
MNISSSAKNHNKKNKRSHQQAGLSSKPKEQEAELPPKRRIKIDLSQN